MENLISHLILGPGVCPDACQSGRDAGKKGSRFRGRSILADSQRTTGNYNPQLVLWWGLDQKEQ